MYMDSHLVPDESKQPLDHMPSVGSLVFVLQPLVVVLGVELVGVDLMVQVELGCVDFEVIVGIAGVVVGRDMDNMVVVDKGRVEIAVDSVQAGFDFAENTVAGMGDSMGMAGTVDCYLEVVFELA